MQDLIIREFSFHQLNANLLWPGTFAFSNWLVENQSLLHGTRILEIGRYGTTLLKHTKNLYMEML